MDIKLLVTDIDDTLLDSKSRLTGRTLEAIRAVLAKGVEVTIATGRMFRPTQGFARTLGLTAPLIAYNGSLVRTPLGEDLLSEPVPAELTQEILALFRKKNWYIQTYINDEFCVERYTQATAYYEHLNGLPPKVMGEDFYNFCEGSQKLLAVAPDQASFTLMKQVVGELVGERLYMAASKHFFLELVHPRANKGRAVEFLAQRLGVPLEQVMAVGDGNNDREMLQAVGLGIAMGNAADAVKESADAVTSNCDQDGLAQAIDKYILQTT